MKHSKLLLISVLIIILVLSAGCKGQTAESNAPEEVISEETTSEEAEETSGEEVVVEDTEAETTEETEAEQPAVDKSGGVLTVAIQGITTLDPVFISDSSYIVANLVYQSLFRQYVEENGDSTLIPDFAESWDIEDEGKTIIFHLHEGIYFQDGNQVFAEGESREVVADDVVFSFLRWLETEGSSVSNDFLKIFESVEALDDYTVELKMSSVNALLFEGGHGIASIKILAPEVVEQLGDDMADIMIGSGPFEFVSYEIDDSVVLQRNEDYYIQPNLDGVVFKVIPDSNVAMMALEADEVDMLLEMPVNEIERMQAEEGYTLIRAGNPRPTQFSFDLNYELFQDIKFREAIAHAVSGNEISKAVFGAAHVDGCGVAGPGVPGWDEELCDKYFSYDPDLALEMLSELGWIDSDNDGLLDKDGEPLVINIEVWNQDDMPRVAEALITQLNALGIDGQLEAVELGTWVQDYMSGSTQKLMGWNGFSGVGGTTTFWGEGGLGEAAGVKDENAQAILSEAMLVIDSELRGSLVKQATDSIYSQYYAIPFGYDMGYIILKDYVNDFTGINKWFNLVTERNNVWLTDH